MARRKQPSRTVSELATRMADEHRKLHPTLSAFLHDDPTRLEKFLTYVQSGATLSAAAAACGLVPDTVQSWMMKGKARKRGDYRSFYVIVSQAIGESCVIAENKVFTNNPETWLKKANKRHIVNENEWTDTPAVTQDTSSTPQAITITPAVLSSILREYADAGLISITESGTALLGCTPSSTDDATVIEGTATSLDDNT